jgi:hypothetical protein
MIIKSLVLAIFITLSINLSANVNISNNTRKNDRIYQGIISRTCEILGIDNIDIIISSGQFYDKMESIGAVAAIKKIGSVYSISIDDTEDLESISISIIHELIHVRQMIDNKLFYYKSFVRYEGRIYNNQNSTYETRPYEVEAVKQALQIYNANRKYFKNL